MEFKTLSPSSIMSYMQCPRRYYGQVTKQIVWKASKSKSRGTLVHSLVEKCLKQGWQDTISWDPDVCKDFIQQQVEEVAQERARGANVMIEHELVVNKKGERCTWWDPDALLRAKADALVANFDEGRALLVDIKTGKKWDEDDFQLRVETLLVHVIYKIPRVAYSYWYVDTGESVDGFIDFTNGLTPVQDIYDIMREIVQAQANEYFPPKRNRFCKWCDFYLTPNCGL